MKDQVNFDLSPDHSKIWIFSSNGKLIAAIDGQYNAKTKELFIYARPASEDINERREVKPLAYLLGFNSLRLELK